MSPDPDDLYAVLVKWARHGKWHTYAQLSHDYEARTGDWFEPHGTWDDPLGDINRRLAAASAPALSSIVVLQDTQRPGNGFWGCADNVPNPRDAVEREVAWGRIVEDVFAYAWPRDLP